MSADHLDNQQIQQHNEQIKEQYADYFDRRRAEGASETDINNEAHRMVENLYNAGVGGGRVAGNYLQDFRDFDSSYDRSQHARDLVGQLRPTLH